MVVGLMANRCDKCGKRPQVGHTVSHSNIKTLRRFVPNTVKREVFDPATGVKSLMRICTACLRTMVKAPRLRKMKAAA